MTIIGPEGVPIIGQPHITSRPIGQVIVDIIHDLRVQHQLLAELDTMLREIGNLAEQNFLDIDRRLTRVEAYINATRGPKEINVDEQTADPGTSDHSTT